MARVAPVALQLLICWLFALQSVCFKVTPVQQVIDMLNEMKTKGETAMQVEKKTFASYTQFVKDQTTSFGQEITTLNTDIEKLTAAIDKMESDVSGHTSRISDLDTQISQTEGEQASSTAEREKLHAEYQKNRADHAESVYALERAIQTLKAKALDTPQATALLQDMAKKSPSLRPALAVFLMDADGFEDSSDGAPAVAAYKFQSSNIVTVLEKLLNKFKSELSDVETQEANQAHAHNMQTQHLGAVASRLTADREEKAALKGKILSEVGIVKGQLAAAKDDLAENEDLLAETKATFAAKSRAFEANQQVRAEELDALHQAVTIISDASVAGGYATHIKLAQVGARPSRARVTRAVSFLQASSSATAARSHAQESAATFLTARSGELRSAVLARAARAAASGNPFTKVIEMIENLVAKLKEEEASEADHKSFCDEELQKNKLKREETAAAVSMLEADMEKRDAEVRSLAAEISTLSDEQASLAKAMSEASNARQKEKTQNEATLKDAQEAQQALKRAIEILREFYSKQATPAALELLELRKQVPEMATYKGMQGGKGGIIGMLEVIESDFLRLETETKSSEAQASREHATFMAKSQKAAKEKHDREFKLSLDKDQEEFELGRTNKEHGLARDSKDEALKYYDTLKPQCLQVHVSYEERVSRREEEIEALKQAYKILDEGKQ